MYNAHFRFREVPFGVTPDPQFYYPNPVYQEAWGTICYGIEARKGFIVLTGEAGTGKTTLLKKAISAFDSTIKIVYVPYTPLNHAELLSLILTGLGLPACDNRSAMVSHFNDYLIEQFRAGNIVALLIDEAQNLSLESLEELRCLGNLETAKTKLVQIVLSGQVELEQKLDQSALRQLKQRVVLRCRLKPVEQNEVKLYMDSRLKVVGNSAEKVFDPAAIEKISIYSTGIPRLINIICDNALLTAYALSERKVSATMIDEVAEELRLSSSCKQKRHSRAFINPLKEDETVKSALELLDDIKHPSPAIYEKQDDSLYDESDDSWLISEDAGRLSTTVNRREGPKGREAFIARQWFRPTIGASIAIVLLTGLGIFLYPGEWRFPLLAGHQIIEMIAPVPSALEPKSSAIIPQMKLSAPQTQKLSTPDQEGSDSIKREPINVLMAAENLSKELSAGVVRSEKPRQAQPENKQESTSRANLAVTANSFVRSSPASNAKIITTLLPGTRIQVTGRVGEYYTIRSLDMKGIRGYVHKEDAFFGSAR